MTLTILGATFPNPAREYDVEVDRNEARIAGAVIAVWAEYDRPDHSVGWSGGWSAGTEGAASLVDRAEWDSVFPGVEPTADTLKALFRHHEAEIAERVAADAEDDAGDRFREPDGDEGDY